MEFRFLEVADPIIRTHPRPRNMLAQRSMMDVGQCFDIEAIGQWQLFQFTGDGLCL